MYAVLHIFSYFIHSYLSYAFLYHSEAGIESKHSLMENHSSIPQCAPLYAPYFIYRLYITLDHDGVNIVQVKESHT